MAHYAFLKELESGIFEVVDVITGRNEDEVVDGISDWEKYYGDIKGLKCLRTSYNARENGFRKNFAGIGYYYDEENDAFIPPKPGEEFILDQNTFTWVYDVSV